MQQIEVALVFKIEESIRALPGRNRHSSEEKLSEGPEMEYPLQCLKEEGEVGLTGVEARLVGLTHTQLTNWSNLMSSQLNLGGVAQPRFRHNSGSQN